MLPYLGVAHHDTNRRHVNVHRHLPSVLSLYPLNSTSQEEKFALFCDLPDGSSWIHLSPPLGLSITVSMAPGEISMTNDTCTRGVIWRAPAEGKWSRIAAIIEMLLHPPHAVVDTLRGRMFLARGAVNDAMLVSCRVGVVRVFEAMSSS
jgi:hypothetical protein